MNIKYSFSLFFLVWVLSAGSHAEVFRELSIAATQQGLKNQRFTLAQLKEYYLARIAKYDDSGLQLNAVVQLNPRLDKIIKDQQQKIEAGENLGAMFGVFVLLKDNIDTEYGMANTAGSWLMRYHYPKKNAFLVQQLIAQDAIILGKTNLSEWANFRSTTSSSGWSSLYGQARNPYDITRSPCGSSSGSGVAVAADFALVAIGTETDGSITCPSAVNGIVGIKPTLGAVSRRGLIPIAHSQDTAGPMARSVADAVILLDAMMGKDNEDTASSEKRPLSEFLNVTGLQGKRIGVLRNKMGYFAELDKVFNEKLNDIKRRGAVLLDVEYGDVGEVDEHEYAVLLSEFKYGLNQYLTTSGAPVKSLQEAIALNRQSADITMPIFAQEIFMQALDAPGIEAKAYVHALSEAKRLASAAIDDLLKQHSLDLLIAPTTTPAWKIDHLLGDHFLGSVGSMAAVSGYPHITVPMGQISGMPVGMSFIGGKWQDGVLIEAAYDFEQTTQARVAPDLR